MSAGRPTKFNQDLADKICEMIAHSDKGLVSICNELGLNASTVYRWINEDKEFCNNYTRAREIQADFLADQIIEIADETSNDTIVTENGIETANHEHISRSRLRVDARKWKASKLFPKKYADRVNTDLTSDGEKIHIPLIEWVK